MLSDIHLSFFWTEKKKRSSKEVNLQKKRIEFKIFFPRVVLKDLFFSSYTPHITDEKKNTQNKNYSFVKYAGEESNKREFEKLNK